MDFEAISTLQYQNRALAKQVEGLKSGEKYLQMDAARDKLCKRTQEYYAVAFVLEEERGKNKKADRTSEQRFREFLHSFLPAVSRKEKDS